jgi:hypothetical protein
MSDLIKIKPPGQDGQQINTPSTRRATASRSTVEEATDTNRMVEEIPYEGHADRRAARAMAMGTRTACTSSAPRHPRDTFTDKRGIKLYWAASIGR